MSGRETDRPERELIAQAWRGSNRSLAALARDALQHELSMTCVPPPPLTPFAYGDLVPLGFLLMALSAGATERVPLREYLMRRRQGILWSFHSNTLVTCIDSALVLQGVRDIRAIEALEGYRQHDGGYAPQLFSSQAEPGVMQITQYNYHWCQSDYATTCLVAALRIESGLDADARTSAYLKANFEQRSGLYFANPYMVDWVAARALRSAAAVEPLRRALADEILASLNDDASFGRYDQASSTALALLALEVLGARDFDPLPSQVRLAELMTSVGGRPPETSFYSSAAVPTDRFPPGILAKMMLRSQQEQFVWVSEQTHGVSLYLDTHYVVTTALATMALAIPVRDRRGIAEPRPSARQKRYACGDAITYIVAHALPPYLRIPQPHVGFLDEEGVEYPPSDRCE